MHDRIDIPGSTHEAWRNTVDITAEIIGVPSAQIVRIRVLVETRPVEFGDRTIP